jgi:sugar/nucleoside kinase (ribokinase family)
LPRLLAVGHVTFDRLASGDALGGSVSYASLAARKLGWQAAVLTCAAPDFVPQRDLPGVEAFVAPSEVTTRFVNAYGDDGERRQSAPVRAGAIDLSALPDAWRDPDVLLLAPVAGELHGSLAPSFQAGVVGAIAQGFVRGFEPDGEVVPVAWRDPATALSGVHVLFLSEHDLPGGEAAARELLAHVPLIALTRGWRGLRLLSRSHAEEVPSLPRPEIDPTGAGDVFAAAFLVSYHETGDPSQAAAFAACAASCVVEGVGASTLGDRAEVEKRLQDRQRMIDDGEWEE